MAARAPDPRLFLFVAVLFVSGCTPDGRYQFLSLFFDGVPDPSRPAQAVSHPAVKKSPVPIDSSLGIAEQAPQFYLHLPYKAKRCAACHASDWPTSVTLDEGTSCAKCHKPWAAKYPRLHGPVAGGVCTGCHNPHMADNRLLLKRAGREVCLYCHATEDALCNEIHASSQNESCTACHNPHGGTNRYFLEQ